MPSLDQVFSCKTSTHSYEIHYTTLGSASSPPLIFIHGTPWSHKVWLPYAQSLSSSFRIYLFDNPGYGVSPGGTPLSSSLDWKTELDASLKGQSEAFSHIFKYWKEKDGWKDKPHVIAHDNAGLVSLRANLLYVCEYKSLCLIDVVAVRPFGSPFFRLVASNPDVFKQIPPGMFRGLVLSYIEGASYKPLRSDVLDMLMEPWLEGGLQGQEGFIRQMLQADQRHAEDVEGKYGEAGKSMPVRIIWGKEDFWIPVDRAEKLAQVIGTEDVVILEEAGHLVHYDQPERLGIEIGRWIESVSR